MLDLIMLIAVVSMAVNLPLMLVLVDWAYPPVCVNPTEGEDLPKTPTNNPPGQSPAPFPLI